ncbi:hypothetical protein GE061_012889 [Apolygus lucorum]|uniref:Cystatin domain-containing protein n=1 Tax=Apolygus lucorum TaxID=248454 RepID=A0A8S9XTW1_APOLU|nr:hypothetical protein GE061_012889 [Apolygus lucorum]
MVHKIGLFLAFLAVIDGTLGGGGADKTHDPKYKQLLDRALVKANAVVVPVSITKVFETPVASSNSVNLRIKFIGYAKGQYKSGVKEYCEITFEVDSSENVTQVEASRCGSE